MKYFEFNKHEYWALVAAESVEKAYEVYAEEVACESAEQVKEEGEPKEVDSISAFIKYKKSVLAESDSQSNEEIQKTFDSLKNTTILITSELA
ncbi:hypothetical protein ACIQHV_11135 [Bacillus bombysepticus]|uniref:Uncharacterized protein n=1 Tax=Bacillus thuringiensis serovar kumamotoensis TaxID=132267 RepID=A0A9X6JSA5_BACUK|nr:hypothetical protein [Bacillus thuringiensis]MEC2869948.1 hypothetical protein [Bacillus cereus]OTZ76202.1 hypothetical protein BK769_07240 [Bacillus thuringiensis serovar kumamtoensis]